MKNEPASDNDAKYDELMKVREAILNGDYQIDADKIAGILIQKDLVS
ncbi:flagellar biosynthesis anti-sigma factor FlgM [Sphingorhabdus lutea]|nr:flagellar biosynthesis anti-sigma factor FlgM [Sphingorhabdus lutea]